MNQKKTVQVRVRIPAELLPKIEQVRKATGLFYPGEVLLLVFQWFLADRELGGSHPQESAGSLRDYMRSLAKR